MTNELPLIVEKAEGRMLLCSPSVGLFSRAVGKNAILTPGIEAGVLETLGVSYSLVTPPGTGGRVANARPELVFEPVGFGTVLYELIPVTDEGAGLAGLDEAVEDAAGLSFRAPYSGRFWHRPSPNDPAFVKEGDVLTEGDTIGLIEVMKTFTHLHYSAEGGLPARATIAKILVADGADVNSGDALVVLEEG